MEEPRVVVWEARSTRSEEGQDSPSEMVRSRRVRTAVKSLESVEIRSDKSESCEERPRGQLGVRERVREGTHLASQVIDADFLHASFARSSVSSANSSFGGSGRGSRGRTSESSSSGRVCGRGLRWGGKYERGSG